LDAVILGKNIAVLDAEVCDWCGRRFNADDALFDSYLDPVTGHARLVTACSTQHMLALAGRTPERRRRRRLLRRRPRVASRRVRPPDTGLLAE